jgi:hypothetical protein
LGGCNPKQVLPLAQPDRLLIDWVPVVFLACGGMRQSHLLARLYAGVPIRQPLIKATMPRIYSANALSPISGILIPPAAFA